MLLALRFALFTKNVPALIAAMTSEVGNAGLNIENMVNASKKDFAYTMMDVIGDVNDSIVNAITAIDGVIKVRVIK